MVTARRLGPCIPKICSFCELAPEATRLHSVPSKSCCCPLVAHFIHTALPPRVATRLLLPRRPASAPACWPNCRSLITPSEALKCMEKVRFRKIPHGASLG